MNDLAEDIEVLWGAYRDNSLGDQVKVTLIATDFADSEIIKKNHTPENEYQKQLMEMYYGNQNRKKQDPTEKPEEVTIPSEIEDTTEEESNESSESVIQKPKFLDRFLKKLTDMVEKIE